MGMYSSVMEEITWHTGLSPTALFTIGFLMIVIYRTVSSMFVSPDDFNKPPVAASVGTNSDYLDNVLGPTAVESKHFGDMTEQELIAYNGSDPNKPLLISVRGQIYDVSSSRNFYGRGGAYSMFTGKEASRALALLSFKPQDINGNIDDLGADELQVLEDWQDKFNDKYPIVGQLVSQTHSSSQNKDKEI